MATWKWQPTGKAETPYDWILLDGGNAVLRFLQPFVEQQGTGEIWLNNILLDRFVNDPAARAKMTEINGRDPVLKDSDPERDIYIPIEMVKPELAIHFDRSANNEGANVAAGTVILATPGDSIELSQVVTAPTGAYSAAGIDIGAAWSPEYTQAALQVSTTRAGFDQPKKIAYFSTPVTESPEDDVGVFYFVSGTSDPDYIASEVPISAQLFQRATAEQQQGAEAVKTASFNWWFVIVPAIAALLLRFR